MLALSGNDASPERTASEQLRELHEVGLLLMASSDPCQGDPFCSGQGRSAAHLLSIGSEVDWMDIVAIGGSLSRIPMSRLVPGVLPLAGAQVTRLAASWVSAGHWRQAWPDIEILAQRFLEGNPDENGMATLAWHHLLLAVGNFKRRGGLIVPARLGNPGTVGTCPDEVAIPGATGKPVRFACEESATWPRLTETPGLGVPTATTVQSALWPSRHVIIDIRDTRRHSDSELARSGTSRTWTTPRSQT